MRPPQVLCNIKNVAAGVKARLPQGRPTPYIALMSQLAGKLQLKGAAIRVIGAPDDLELDLCRDDAADAVIVFVRTRSSLDGGIAPAIEAARADRIAWIAYPRAGQLGTDLNRDILAKLLQGLGVRPVRQVAVDEVWSALRFRPA